ncbi:MAG: EamA family transporter [Lautropia sp.]
MASSTAPHVSPPHPTTPDAGPSGVPNAAPQSNGTAGRAGILTPLVVGCLAATWLVWGSTYLAIRYALESFPPFLQMASRFLIAGALLLAWMVGVRRARWPTVLQWRNAAIVGTLMLGGGMGGTAVAEQTIGSGLVVAFIAVVPIMITAINGLFGVWPSRRELAGIAVGLAGVLLLVRGSGFQASPGGLIAVTIATLAWSAGSVLSQRRYPLAPGAVGFAAEMLCGGAALTVLGLVAGEPAVLTARWPPTALASAAWIYLVVFGSLIAFNAYMMLLARVPAALASSYTLVTPVIGLALGVLIGGEIVTGAEWLAATVVLGGVVLLLTAPRG